MARYVDVEKAEYPYLSMSMFGINSKDCKIYNEGVKATEDMIQALPTADVEVVRHGYWKDLYDNKYDNHLYVCSECGGKALFEFYQNELDQTKERQVLSSGCSHCRAKMDGGKDE